MKLGAIALTLGSMFVLSATALAGDYRAGTDGHVTAYDSNKVTVIDVDPCPRRGSSWDYVSCGRAFRDKINDRLCRTRGAGKHTWFYQVGDSKSLIENTARCGK